MKREEFVRRLTRDGCLLLRPGAKHDIYINPATNKKQPVPRHAEIANRLAKHIRKHLGLR